MTIRMTQDYEDWRTGQVVETSIAVAERLVALGYAVIEVDGSKEE